MKVAVLGCGPAGLMACHAARQQGAEVDVFSHKVLSPIGGAQYLHEQIPGLTKDSPDRAIRYRKIGTAEGYAKKVYGDPDAPTSWAEFPEGDVPGWSLREAYLELVRRYWENVHELFVKPEDIDTICRNFDLVFCTLPARTMCLKRDEHTFEGQPVVLMPHASVDFDDEGTITYNGMEEFAWYRSSALDGKGWTEYSLDAWERRTTYVDDPAIISTVVKGIKPIKTDCDCHQHHDAFVRLGRFGQWRKAVLTSDAYKDARLITNETPEVSHAV